MIFSLGRLRLKFLMISLCLLPFASFAADIPTIQHFEGPGGIKVFLVESHANPMVEIKLLLRAGSAYDPKDKEGVASLTAWMFNEGGGRWIPKPFGKGWTFMASL